LSICVKFSFASFLSQILKRDKIIIEQYDPLQLPARKTKDDEKDKQKNDDMECQELPSIELTPLRQFELKEISTSQIGNIPATYGSHRSVLSSLKREQHDTVLTQSLPLPSGTIDKVFSLSLSLLSLCPFFEIITRKIEDQTFP
jgi:hypothetical protein